MTYQGKQFSPGSQMAERPAATTAIILFLLASHMTATAAPLEIQVWDRQFSSYTYSRLTDYAYNESNPDPAHITIVSNRLTSAQPLSDSIHSPGWNFTDKNYTGPLQLEAKADASAFRLETFAQSAGGGQPLGHSRAATLSTTTFSPLATGFGTFNIDLLGWRQYYGAQLVRLTDLTLGQEVWSYGYSGLGANATERFERLLPSGTTYQQDILWEFTGNGTESGFHLDRDTFLTVTSTYELTLFSTVESQAPETERVIIEWAGALAAVPEPSTLALLGLGTLVLLRRRKSVVCR